jgi:hypothetical protein
VIDDDALRRLVRTHTTAAPATREHCPTPEVLQDAATTPRDTEAHRAVLEHVATCAPCRRDFDLLRTAHLAAPAVVRAAMPRWIPALAAAAVIAVVSLVAIRSNEDVVRGAPNRATTVQLLAPLRVASGTQLQWRAVPQAVSYRVEVTDNEGNLAFSTETADTVTIAATRADASLRWSVEARLLDGTVLTSALDTLPSLP